MLWLRVRRVPACAATIFATAVTVVLVGDLPLPLPSLLGGPRLAVPLALLLPLAVAIVVAWGLTTGDPVIEAVASRPLCLLDVVYALTAATFGFAAGTAAWALAGTDLALAAGRNTLGYVGLILVGRRVIGPDAAAILPASFAVVTSLFGSGGGRQLRWWAWPLAPAGDIAAWGSAVVVLLLGAVVAFVRTSE